jgi:predicted RNase H-like HicB family nuclease
MLTNKRITMIVEKTDTGFSAYSENHPLFTTSETIPDLINNAYEAMQLYFENEKLVFEPDTIKFEIDFAQFFQYYKVLNSKFLAEKIGMHPTLLSQYIRGHKKPSPVQAEKILHGIHRIGKELSDMNLIYQRGAHD